MSDREQAGLSAHPAERATEEIFERMPVTQDERDLILHNERVRSELDHSRLLRRVEEIYGNRFVGIHWVAGDGLTINVIGTDSAERDALLQEFTPDMTGIVVQVVKDGVPAERQDLNNKYITDNARALNDLGYVASAGDDSCGHILIKTALGTNTKPLIELLSKGIDLGDVSIVEDVDGSSNKTYARTSAHSTQIGGLHVTIDGNSACTTNIPWNGKYSGRYVVTAGHCSGTWNRAPYYATGVLPNTPWVQGGQTVNDDHGESTSVVFGGFLDMSVTRLDDAYLGAKDTVVGEHPSGNDITHRLTWFQWHPSMDRTADLGYQGDEICQSGISQTSIQCGILTSKTFTRTGWFAVSDGGSMWSHFHNLRSSTTNATFGDSGGTVYHLQSNGNRNLTGLVHGPGVTGIGSLSYPHISYAMQTFPFLGTPVEMP